MKIVIEGLFYHKSRGRKPHNRTFPGLNDFIVQAARNPNYRNQMKRKYQDIADTFIRQQADRTFEGKVYMFYNFYETDKRRDPSNISSFFIKVFEDALQECGVIPNDNWNIVGYACYFHVDKKHPRVEIEIEDGGPREEEPKKEEEPEEDDKADESE